MDKIKGVAKGGWHPSEKGSFGLGQKMSLRGDNKGLNQVAGWVGKGKQKSDYDPEDHRSAPLSSLKDPDSFGPPPKRGAESSYSPSSSTASPAARSTYTSRGLGAAIPKEDLQARDERLERERREAEEEEEERANAPPVPYKANTTGLSTAGLPTPPLRRNAEPPPVTSSRPKPSLPPRLPPRGGAAISPPPTYNDAVVARPEEGQLNTGAINRLGQAGVSVPGFDIGGNASARQPRASDAQAEDSPASPVGHGGQLNELQARFARMRSSDAWSAEPATSAGAASPQRVAGKKPPPPPPPKKKELHGLPSHDTHAPPPVPLASRPSWNS